MLSLCSFTQNYFLRKQLTLFWLTFPVYKVDDIAILQHVSLLLDQFGHVNHSAISAIDKQMYKSKNGRSIISLSNTYIFSLYGLV